MASGWNLWVWLKCIGVASRCCYKEVYRYSHRSFFGSSILTSLFIFKCKNKNKNKKPKWRFLTSRGAHVNCAIMAMLYTHPIGNQPWNTMVVFKMRESVPTARYSPVCNVLRQWKTSLILTYRVYRLYDSPVDLPR